MEGLTSQRSKFLHQLPKLWFNILISAGLLVVPCLAIFHTIVPDSGSWTINGVTYQIQYFEHWRTFIWQLILLVIPVMVSTTLLITLPKTKTPRYVIILLIQVLVIFSYWAAWLVDSQRNVEDHNEFLYILGALLLAGLVMLIRNYRKLTYREKNFELLRVIEEIEKEDLPAFFSFLMDVDIRVDSMKDSDHIDWWKQKLHTELNIGKQGVGEALTKLDKYKKKLQ